MKVKQRFYFANNSHAAFKTGGYMYFVMMLTTHLLLVMVVIGHFHEPSGNNYSDILQDYKFKGDNGLDIDSDSVGLSSGQRSVVLRADGDKQWIDRYGIIKRNRQSISESITINNGDSCSSNGSSNSQLVGIQYQSQMAVVG